MKTLKLAFGIALASAGLIMGCADDAPEAEHLTRPVQISPEVSARTTDFAFNFLHTLQETQPAADNLFVSPLSLHIALGMLVNGAENETAAEITKALEMEGLSLDEINKAYNTLINELPAADSQVSLSIANSVWYRNDYKVENSFKDVLAKSFNSEVTGLPFNDEAKNRINQWASEKTNGKISKVLDQIKPEHVMFLLNAVYFKGDWKTKFETSQTADAPFKLTNGSSKPVKMMFSKSSYKVSRNTTYDAVQLPYGGGQYAMTLIVPTGQNAVDNVLTGIDGAAWNTLNTSFREQTVRVGLPRFTLNYSANLEKTLDKMGIKKAFTDRAEFLKIAENGRLYVDFVKQDTYLNIDEKGTEAAAVTSIGIGVTSASPDLNIICDRPFGLIISENTSNTILFIGRITNPDSK